MIMAKPGAVITGSLRLSAFASATSYERQPRGRAGVAASPLHQLAEAVAAFEGGEEEAVIRHDHLLAANRPLHQRR
jgi:hypothetical protein